LSMRAALAALGFALSLPAQACGYCVEDKIASTYDHAVVSRALAQRHHVAFFHVDGPAAPGNANRRALEVAAYAIPGVDKRSVRVSPDALTMSLSFDPGRVSLATINARLDRKLSARRLALMPMRIMDKAADLKVVAR
jgi:hypothetical protein